MKKMKWKKGCACLAAIALLTGSVHMPAAAANVSGQRNQQKQNGAVVEKIFTSQNRNKTMCVVEDEYGLSNDELFEGYLEQLFYGGVAKYSLKGASSGNLGATERTLYNALKEAIIKIADGTQTSTEITIDTIDGVTTEEYTSESDLNTAKDALKNKAMKVVDMLLADCPYELYWFKKTEGAFISIAYSRLGSIYKIDGLQVDFTVDKKYGSGYTVDPSGVKSAKAAKANADAIVAEYASLDDYEKLDAYRQKICDLTEYNDDAAKSGSSGVEGIDPWQLIYVFDDDDTTNVVCEGYSKAFAYLCEQSSFDGNIKCYIVTGTLTGDSEAAGASGGHMWNIVTMEDGKNYIVDITNCDDGSIGNPDMLFLAGLPGTVEGGYTFTRDSQTVSFKYNAKTLSMYDSTILALEENGYTHVEKENQEELTIAAILDKTYGDADFQLSAAGGTTNGAITYRVPGNNGVLSINGSTASIIGAGTVKITATMAGNATYKPVSATRDLTVNKKSLTPSITGTVTKKHDNTTSVVQATTNTLLIELKDVLEKDKSNVSATATFTYESADIGDNKNIIATNITLSGSGAGNYALSSNTASAAVGKIEAAGSSTTGGSTTGGSTTGGSTTGGSTTGGSTTGGSTTGGSTTGSSTTGGSTTGGSTTGGSTTGGSTSTSTTPASTAPASTASASPAPASTASASPAPASPAPVAPTDGDTPATSAPDDTSKTETVTNPDGSVTTTVTETDDSGNVTTTVTETDDSGNVTQVTETTTEQKEDGTTVKTETVTSADNKVTTTVTTTDTDGSAKEVRSETGTNSKNKNIEVTTTTNTDADGSVTSITKTTVIENIAPNTTATITTESSNGEAPAAKASVSITIGSGNKMTLSKDITDQITEAAGEANVKATITLRDSSGKVKYTVDVATANLETGNNLYIYEVNSKTGEYIMVNAKTYTVDADGNIQVSMKDNKTYELLSQKESQKINKTILNTVAAKKASANIKKGKKTQFKLSGKLNTANVKSITYTSPKKSVATISGKGKITAKKKGTVTVKAKVVLKNGAKKTVSMKIKVK